MPPARAPRGCESCASAGAGGLKEGLSTKGERKRGVVVGQKRGDKAAAEGSPCSVLTQVSLQTVLALAQTPVSGSSCCWKTAVGIFDLL